MTNTRPDLSLSRVELVVLARLSCTKRPSERDVANTIEELALPAKDAVSSKLAASTLTQLRHRGLMHAKHRTLTDNGNRALQAAFGLNKTPLWKDIHVSHLLACALGLPPGTEKTQQAMKDATAVARTFLGAGARLPKNDKSADKLLAELLQLSSSSLELKDIRIEIADRLIRTTLGLIGPVTMSRMRAQILQRQPGGVVVATSKQALLAEVAKQLGEPCDDKRMMSRALIRRWVYEVVSSHRVENSHVTRTQGDLNLSDSSPPPKSLLELVRDTLPRVGADGRFGSEKVFVSALWHRIERERRVGLSLDGFKSWLIDANREQQIDLARADLLGSMDPRLVAESQIEDLGAIFHFVIDRQASANRRPYAR